MQKQTSMQYCFPFTQKFCFKFICIINFAMQIIYYFSDNIKMMYRAFFHAMKSNNNTLKFDLSSTGLLKQIRIYEWII